MGEERKERPDPLAADEIAEATTERLDEIADQLELDADEIAAQLNDPRRLGLDGEPLTGDDYHNWRHRASTAMAHKRSMLRKVEAELRRRRVADEAAAKDATAARFDALEERLDTIAAALEAIVDRIGGAR